MNPTTMVNVFVFILAVIPGVTYEILRARTQLPREESTFVHVSRVLVFGTLITALTILLLASVRWIAPAAVVDLSKLIKDGTPYIADHLAAIGWTLGLQLAWSILLAVVFNDLTTPRGARRIYQADAWHALAELAAEPGQKVGVSVRFKSGRDVIGHYYGASTELDPSKRELILAAPFYTRETGSGTTIALSDSWHRMTVLGAEIESLTITYIGDPESSSGHPARSRKNRTNSWFKKYYLSWKAAVIASAVLWLSVIVIGNLKALAFGLFILRAVS